jgi:PAS domain S-box-containing protein
MDAGKQFNLVLMKDITEVKRLEALRQQAETAVQESHQQMLAIWESITDAYTMLDLEWRIVYANRTSMGMLCQLANLEPEEILGKTHWELFPWTVGHTIEGEYRRAMAQQVPVHLEVLYEPTGNWFEIHAYPSPVGLGLYFRGISDRKQLEIALQTSEEKLRLALDLNTIGIWEWNIATGIVYWNASHYIVLGYQPGEFEPSYQRWRDRIHPDDIEFAEQTISQALETHTDYEAEFRLLLDDGSIRWLHSKGRAIYDEEGKPLRMIGVEYDITDRKQAEAALRQNEQLLRLALAGAKAGSWDWELATGKLTWSPEMYHLYGLDRDRIDPASDPVQYDIWYNNYLHPDDRQRVSDYLASVLEQRLSEIQIEHRIFHPERGFRWLFGLGRLTVNDRGEPVRFNGITLDISDRKQAELMRQQQIEREQAIADIAQDIRRSLVLNEVLSRTVERVRNLLNTDRVIIFRFRPDWQGDVVVESVGAEWVSILSTTIFDPCFEEHYIEPYRQGQISSMSDIDAEHLEPCYVELLKPLQVKANLVIPLLPGEQLWGLLIAHQCSAPRQWQNAEIELLQQLANQVSIAIQQSELYQKIREQAALIDIATDAIFVRDLDNNILFWNQGAERLYGWTAEEALGKPAAELFEREAASQPAESLLIVAEKGFWQGELEQVTKSGKEVKVASRWTLVRDESGQPKSILVVNSDITEKKQLEKQFYRAQRLESIGTLASGIAHDFNNILTPMLAVSHLLPLKFPHLDEQTKQMLEILEVSANRGASLVKQVLSFSRGQEGKRVTLQVEHLLSEVVTIANRTFPKSIQISANIPRMELWTISADATQIHQVLMNLIVNARDAMPNGGSLTISAENRYLDENYAVMNLEADEGCYVMITISDTGIGIPPELLERIFDPFFTTKEVGQGTGLGLATVMGIVKNHGGFVRVYSEMGNGTQFQVYLPASEERLSQPILEEKLPIGNGELILIVDDEPTIRQIAKTSLEKYNYTTLFASDGIEALSLYGKHQKEISVVLIDMMMPNLDGLTTIRAMQIMNPQVRAIATSGLAANSQLALSVNVKTFLLKPYTLEELLNALHEAISTTNSQTD